MNNFDPYNALGVERNANEQEIKAAYKQALRSVHPDRDAGLDEKGRELNAARREDLLRAQDTLLNPRKRTAFETGQHTQQMPGVMTAPGMLGPAPAAPASQESYSQSYAQGLAAARVRGAIIRHLTPAAKAELTEPSSTKFAVAEIWIFIGEVLNFAEDIVIAIATFFGVAVGGFIAWCIALLVDLILFDIPILFLVGGSIRNNAAILEQANEEIEMHHRRLISYRTRYAAVLKSARKIPGMRRPVNRIALRYADIRKSASKSAWGRLWKRFGVDEIPFVGMWPTRFFGVRKQKKLAWEVYELAKEALKERERAKEEADEADEQFQEQLAA